MFLTRERIRRDEFWGASADFKTGASVLFLGLVRDHSEGRKVLYLEYEAYEEMAERMLAESPRGINPPSG